MCWLMIFFTSSRLFSSFGSSMGAFVLDSTLMLLGFVAVLASAVAAAAVVDVLVVMVWLVVVDVVVMG